MGERGMGVRSGINK